MHGSGFTAPSILASAQIDIGNQDWASASINGTITFSGERDTVTLPMLVN
jgi:hypothetical protein